MGNPPVAAAAPLDGVLATDLRWRLWEALHFRLAEIAPFDPGIRHMNRLLRLRIDHAKWGWDIPGGHLEDGEGSEAALRREVYEEAGAQLGGVELLGYNLVRVLAPKPAGYRYPYPDSYMVVYWAHVAALDRFSAHPESRCRMLLAPAAVSALPWMPRNRALYELAFAAAHGDSGGGERR